MRRKAVSEILGAILIIVVAVIASVVFYNYIMGIVAQPPDAEAERSIIVIEALKQENQVLIAYLRNVGNIPVTISSAYLVDHSSKTVAKSYLSLSVSIEPKELKQINLDITGVSPGLYTVKFVTSAGGSVSLLVYLS